VLRKAKTWSKAGGVYPLYLRRSIPLRLSDEQRVERDVSALHQRVASRKKIDAAWQRAVDMKDAQIKAIKEGRDHSVGVYKDLHESSFAAPRAMHTRAGINDGMPSSRTGLAPWRSLLEVYAEQTAAELDDARSELPVEVVSIEVVEDAMAFIKKKRKRKRKWEGDRGPTKFLAMEFATNDCKGATSIEDRAKMRASAMLSMASNAKKIDMGPTDAQRLSVALQELRSSASVVGS
jgi:hypothetical protein